MIYRLGGWEICNYLTHLFESAARDINSDPYRYLVSYSCRDGEVSWDRSGIYLHFFRME